MRERIRQIFGRAKHRLDRLWKWAKGHGPRRWKALADWAKHSAVRARAHDRYKSATGWVKRRTIYARKYRRAKARHDGGDPDFETWMANGCPTSGVHQSVLDFIARAVVRYGLYTTATTNGVHAATSWHYSGHAADVAGAWDKMVACQKAEYARGQGNAGVYELFGPDNGDWLKNGAHMYIAEGDPLESMHDTHVHRASA